MRSVQLDTSQTAEGSLAPCKFHGNHGLQERGPDLKRAAYQKQRAVLLLVPLRIRIRRPGAGAA